MDERKIYFNGQELIVTYEPSAGLEDGVYIESITYLNGEEFLELDGETEEIIDLICEELIEEGQSYADERRAESVIARQHRENAMYHKYGLDYRRR